MLVTKLYDRNRAVTYAEKWALSRNPLFLDYTGRGGNCTNFVSQCLYAGSCIMNTTPIFGWFYFTSSNRTASWTGVEFLYNFLIDNVGVGPFATEVGEGELELGDVIQLGRNNTGYYHTLLVTGFDQSGYLVSAQSDDFYNRPLANYSYDYARFLHIEGVRADVTGIEDCYPALLDGTALIVNEGNLSPAMPPTVEMPAEPPAEASPAVPESLPEDVPEMPSETEEIPQEM